MFGPQQAITNPFGITVFGSATNSAVPDIASIDTPQSLERLAAVTVPAQMVIKMKTMCAR